MAMTATRSWKRNAGAAALAFAVLGGTAACAGGGSDSGGGESADSASGGSGSAGEPGQGRDAPKPAQVDGLAASTDSSGGTDATDTTGSGSTVLSSRAPVDPRAVISTGRVVLEAKDLGEVRDGLDRMLGKYGGFVADEQTYNDAQGRTESSVLTLRIPSEHFEDALRELDGLGKVQDRKTTTDDVTTEVIDVDARIRTEQVSLDRLRGFLSKANDVDAMIRLESEIASREANLASLQAQQRYLDDQTAMSTLVLTMHEPSGVAPPPAKDDPLKDAGFLTGLQNGWDALLGVLLVVATVLGAVLPFLVVIALVGLPALLWLRRHRPAAPPAPADAG